LNYLSGVEVQDVAKLWLSWQAVCDKSFDPVMPATLLGIMNLGYDKLLVEIKPGVRQRHCAFDFWPTVNRASDKQRTPSLEFQDVRQSFHSQPAPQRFQLASYRRDRRHAGQPDQS
jgi:hypothetical protein